MSAQGKTLENSISDFEKKKRKSLDFMTHLIELKEQFDSEFPSGSPAEGDRLGLEKLRAARARTGDAQLKILFAGRFKTGKSTLLNAMLGTELLPDEVTPCTAVITEIEYGESPSAVLYFKEGINIAELPQTLNAEVAAHIQKHAPDQPPPMEIQLSSPDALHDYLTIPLGEEHVRGVRESPYAKCALKWPIALCKGGAVLIDSPGLNEHEARDATTIGYLDEADMIIHVLPASQLCDKCDKNFIEDVKRRGKGGFPIIFVVNRFDQLRNDRERDKIRDYAGKLKELDGIYGSEGLFFTAALPALEARMAGREEELAASGLTAVENKIADVFTNDRAAIKLANIRDVVADLEKFSTTGIADLQNLMDRDMDKIAAAYADTVREFDILENEIARIRAKAERVASRFEKSWKLGLSDFFSSFQNRDLREIIENVDLPEINALNRKNATSASIELLNAAVNESLGEQFKAWIYTEGAALENAALLEIQDEIQENLREFGDTLARLRAGMDLEPLSCGNAGMVEFTDFMPDALAGAGVGGAMGGAAVFIAARFLPVVAGPVGWAIVAGTTILMAISLFLGADAREKLKKEFYENASKGLMRKSSDEVGRIAQVAGLKFRERMMALCLRLQERIEDARRPLEITRRALENDRSSLEEKKAHLEKFRNEFAAMLGEGREIAASL